MEREYTCEQAQKDFALYVPAIAKHTTDPMTISAGCRALNHMIDSQGNITCVTCWEHYKRVKSIPPPAP
jgi:hypothetical protein